MRIRITKAGVGKVILQRSDWPEDHVLTVSKYDGDMFVREGWGELVNDEPAPVEVAEEEAPEAEPETATAEPFGETTMQKPRHKRRGG
jgi:hypothetical protein